MIQRETIARLFRGDLPNLAEALGWSLPPDAPAPELISTGTSSQVAVAGRQGVGKRTLCRSLWGWNVGAQADQDVQRYGRMMLVHLPEEPVSGEDFTFHFSGAKMVLYVVDAAQGVTDADSAWIARLRALNSALVVVANKADLLAPGALKPLLKGLRDRLGCPVLPAVATDLVQVHRVFLPAVLSACPEVAETLATEIGGLRQQVAWSLAMRAALTSAMIATEGDTEYDTASLVTLQMRLMRRIGMLYGFKPSGGRGRQLALGVLITFVFSFVPVIALRIRHVRVWMVYGTVAAGTTLLIGRLAVFYYSAPLPGWLRWL